jgi:hypothetical protein
VTPIKWFGLGALVFLSATAYDWANCNYIKASAEDAPGRAAGWSGLTSVFGLIGLLGMLSVSIWLAVPEVAGFMFGSWLAVWLRLRRFGGL